MKAALKLQILVSAQLLLAGCGTTASVYDQLSTQEIAEVDARELCVAYKKRRSESIRTELQRRDLFSYREWSLIDRDQISFGMSELALLCSFGAPARQAVVDRDGEGEEAESQWTYNVCTICNEFHVYVRNGEVSRWEQD